MLVRRSRGDTIIEVVVAFAVFSLLFLGVLAIMNRGVAIARKSLEVTLVRQQMDSQADLLRYVRDNDQALWQDIISQTTASVDEVVSCPWYDGSTPAGAFFVAKPSGAGSLSRIGIANISQPETISKIDYENTEASGIWVQMLEVTSDEGVPQGYDAHIRACWDVPGFDQPQTLSTIVRLYER